MTVGIYIRVSTEEQANEGYSISAQKERLKAFCIAQNWNEHKFYVDEGISGRNINRPQFKKLMADIEAGHISTLLVYRLDRLTRSVRDLHKILDELDKHNCIFRSATEIYDTSTAMGRMFITIVAAIAEWESANLGERVIMGQIEKARQGEWAAQPPYGWYKDEKHKLHIHEKEIKAVQLMIKKILGGYSFRQLANYMSSTEYKPRRGYKWHIKTLLELMHNPVLYGAMKWKNQIYENTHEGIITKEEFEHLQKVISSRQNLKKRNVNHDFIYQMKISCPHCGGRLSCERTVWKNKDGTINHNNRYRCQACTLNSSKNIYSVSEKVATQSLVAYLDNMLLAPANNKTLESDIDTSHIHEEMKKIERQREKYQRAWAEDLITDEEFKQRMSESRLRYADLEQELKKVAPSIQNPKDLERAREYAKIFRSNFLTLTQEEKRQFIQTFVDSIITIADQVKKGEMRREMMIAEVRFY